MVTIIEAIYEDGVLKPLGELLLAEHERVRLTVESLKPVSKETTEVEDSLRRAAGLWADRTDLPATEELIRSLRNDDRLRRVGLSDE